MLKIVRVKENLYNLGVRFALKNAAEYGFAIREVTVCSVNAINKEIELLVELSPYLDDYKLFCELAFSEDNNILEYLEKYYCMKINCFKFECKGKYYFYTPNESWSH